LRERQQLWNILNGVLPVGIHLHGVAETRRGCGLQTADHRRAFAGIFRQANQRQPGILRRQLFQHPARRRVAAIVDHNARQIAGP
jgi:hypothetical protein